MSLYKAGYTLRIILLLCVSTLYFLGKMIYYNPTISERVGYYFTYSPRFFGLEYKKGDLILFCLGDKKGSDGVVIKNHHIGVLQNLGLPDIEIEKNICGNKTAYLLKQIVALAGDVVIVTDKGVVVNGMLYPNSKPQTRIKHNGVLFDLLPIEYGKIYLAKDEYFVLGKSLNSYDSRYFGRITLQHIYRKAKFLGGW